jgi:phage tail-like protein
MPDNNPYGAFSFVVELDGLEVAGFSEVSGLEFETEVIEYRTGDTEPTVRKLPGLTKYANVTLKRGLTADPAMWEWIIQSQQRPVLRRNGSIVLLDENREPALRWEFRNGWPCKYRGPVLDATGNEVAIETLEICHESLHLDRR